MFYSLISRSDAQFLMAKMAHIKEEGSPV
jgi:hypothetical protein